MFLSIKDWIAWFSASVLTLGTGFGRARACGGWASNFSGSFGLTKLRAWVFNYGAYGTVFVDGIQRLRFYGENGVTGELFYSSLSSFSLFSFSFCCQFGALLCSSITFLTCSRAFYWATSSLSFHFFSSNSTYCIFFFAFAIAFSCLSRILFSRSLRAAA